MSAIRNFFQVAFSYAKPKELLGRIGELIIGYPIYALSFLFPRSKKKWVFGTNVGFTDNAKYLYLYTLEQGEIEAYWISKKKDVVKQMRSMNLPAYYCWSWKGLYTCLRASVYVYTSHTQCINFFTSGGAKKVNLWHGVGIKSGKGDGNKDTSTAYKSIFMRIAAPHNYEKDTLFLSTSSLMSQLFASYIYGCNEMYEGMYPRCAFLMKPLHQIEADIKKYETADIKHIVQTFKQYKHVVLYMPTWRRNLKDEFIKEAGFDFQQLNDVAKAKNMLFVFKLHPAVKYAQSNALEYSNLCFLDKNVDVYPLLPFTTMLITDYSSIYYDYILMEDKEIILFPFDKDEYERTSEKLAFSYDDYTPGPRAYSFKSLLEMLQQETHFDNTTRKKITKLFWGEEYYNKTIEQLYQKITSLL